MAITKQEFLQKIRTKYPSYANVDDNTLYDKIITKYPEYKSQVTEEPSKGLIGAAPEVVKDIGGTIKDYGVGVGQDIVKGVKEIPAGVKGIYERGKERFGKAVDVGMRDIETQGNISGTLSAGVAGGLATAGTLFDTAFTAGLNLLEIVAPEKAEEAVKGGMEKLAPALQQVSNRIEEFKNTSPEAKQLVDKASLILEGAVLPGTGAAATGVVKRGLQQTGKQISQGIKVNIPKATQQIKQGVTGVKETISKSNALERLRGVGTSVSKTSEKIGETLNVGVEKAAGKILGSETGKKELFQATSPSYQTLGKDKNISNIGRNIEKADETVLKYGKKPVDTESRAIAYKDTMKEVWNKVENAREGTSLKTDARKFADMIEDEINAKIKRGEFIPSDEADIKALRNLADYYRKLGEVDVPTLGGMRARINAETSFKQQNPFGDMYNTVLKNVGKEIRTTENGLIDSVRGGKFGELMQEYRALSETYPDILKANIKNMRAKGLGLTESFSRITGIGDILGGAINIATKGKEGIAEVGKGLGKVALGKVYGKLKDPDFLIKEGYEKLSKTLSPKNIKDVSSRNINTPSPNKYSKKPTKATGQTKGGVIKTPQKVTPKASTKGVKPKTKGVKPKK